MRRDMNFNVLVGASVVVAIMASVMTKLLLPAIWQLYLLAFVTVIVAGFAATKKSKFLYSIAILLVLVLGAFTAGVFIVDSMVKGIEIVSGPQTGKFLLFDAQIGLINMKDATYALLTFAATALSIFSLVVRRRRYE